MKVSAEELSSMFVYDAMLVLANRIEPYFPHHAKCVKDELLVWTMDGDGNWSSAPRNMTETRWNRLANIICSLVALPGIGLTVEARHTRLNALCLSEAARAMARHRFGGKRANGALDLAVHIASENGGIEANPTPEPA
jgi:hypothetical protein